MSDVPQLRIFACPRCTPDMGGWICSGACEKMPPMDGQSPAFARLRDVVERDEKAKHKAWWDAEGWKRDDPTPYHISQAAWLARALRQVE